MADHAWDRLVQPDLLVQEVFSLPEHSKIPQCSPKPSRAEVIKGQILLPMNNNTIFLTSRESQVNA